MIYNNMERKLNSLKKNQINIIATVNPLSCSTNSFEALGRRSSEMFIQLQKAVAETALSVGVFQEDLSK